MGGLLVELDVRRAGIVATVRRHGMGPQLTFVDLFFRGSVLCGPLPKNRKTVLPSQYVNQYSMLIILGGHLTP